MLRGFRGRVIYVPILVPDNAQIAGSYGCFLLGWVLLIAAVASPQWSVVQRTIPSLTYDFSYDLDLGLRSLSVKFCAIANRANTSGTSPSDELQVTSGCGHAVVYYTACSSRNFWCGVSPSNHVAAFWLTLVVIVLSVVAQAVTLFKRRAHVMVCLVTAVFTLYIGWLVADGSRMFRVSESLLKYLGGRSTLASGTGLIVVWISFALFLLSTFLAAWGALKMMHARLQESANAVPGEAVAPPSATDAPTADVPLPAAPTASSERLAAS